MDLLVELYILVVGQALVVPNCRVGQHPNIHTSLIYHHVYSHHEHEVLLYYPLSKGEGGGGGGGGGDVFLFDGD